VRVRQPRQRNGSRRRHPIDRGLEGVIAANTVLSQVDGREGTILMRGHTIDDLVKNHGLDGTVAIMWNDLAVQGLARERIQGASNERLRRSIWIGTTSKR